MKLLVIGKVIEDIEELTSGSPISDHYHLKALGKVCDVTAWNGRHARTAKMGGKRQRSLRSWLCREAFDGVLMLERDPSLVNLFISLADSPILIRCYAVRGYHGTEINRLMDCYGALRHFDGIAVISEWAKSQLAQLVCREGCLRVIPCGVDLELFKPLDKKQAKSEIASLLKDPRIARQPVAGYLSRFQPEKGAGVFVRAARLAPDILFLAAGPVVANYSEPLPENLILAGSQPRYLLPLFYNAFDVYCFPSLVGTESFGLSVLEAMACGVPPIVTDFDGTPEVVGHAGVKVRTRCFDTEIAGFVAEIAPEDLADSIRYLIDDPARRQELGERAVEKSRNFGWDAIARQLVRAFESLRLRKLEAVEGPHDFRISFSQCYKWPEGEMLSKSFLRTRKLRKRVFEIAPEEGVALCLLQTHSLGQVEAALLGITKDLGRTRSILQKALTFLRQYPTQSQISLGPEDVGPMFDADEGVETVEDTMPDENPCD